MEERRGGRSPPTPPLSSAEICGNLRTFLLLSEVYFSTGGRGRTGTAILHALSSVMPPSVPSQYRWHHELKQLFVLALERYRVGERDPARFFTAEQQNSLASIGMSAQELYDFAEDHSNRDGDPDWETVLLIAAARRDYLLTVQHGVASTLTVSIDALPPKDAALGGIPWLPRVLKKAEAKLRGEMSADYMFGCGGDRNFFREHHLHPADFLRHVWAANGDEQRVLEYVQNAKAQGDAGFADAAPE